MDGSIDGFDSESTAKLVMTVVAVTVVVPILAIEAPVVLTVLAVVVPLLWFVAQTDVVDGVGDSDPTDGGAALDRLRRRYVDGELTDEEFERRLDRLLETETLEDAERYRTAEKRRTDRSRDAELER